MATEDGLARLVPYELQIHRYPVSTFKLFQTVVAHALIPAVLRKKQGHFWVCGHTGIKGEFQDKQIYTEKPCLIKKNSWNLIKDKKVVYFWPPYSHIYWNVYTSFFAETLFTIYTMYSNYGVFISFLEIENIKKVSYFYYLHCIVKLNIYREKWSNIL